ncbi:MAG: hypothetical protein WC693_01010 [Patescibacteria group bacterium]|jgi:hypothetical protein
MKIKKDETIADHPSEECAVSSIVFADFAKDGLLIFRRQLAEVSPENPGGDCGKHED